MKMNMIRLALVCLFLTGASGCFKHVINYGEGGSAIKYSKSEAFFIYGLASQADLDVSKICKSKNATVRTEQSFLDGLLRVLTFAIYTPSTVTVMCDK